MKFNQDDTDIWGMKKIFSLSVLFFGIMVSLSSCYYDNVQDLYPINVACDTTNVTYSQSIAPITSANCNVCHSGATPQYGFKTDNYQGLSTVTTGGLNSLLWQAVSHQPGITPMPYQNGSLSNCDLARVRVWLREGAPNN